MATLVFEWSKVSDGNMSFKYGDKETVIKNRKRFFGENETITLNLSGGSEIVEVTKEDIGKMVEADAAITYDTNLPLFLVVGDCFPVAIFDPKENKLALVHLGFSGIMGGLVKEVLERFNGNNLVVKIGPGARKESYKFLHEEVKQKDEVSWEGYLEKGEDGMTRIDLAGYLKKQITDCGVKLENIEDCGIDTISDPNYFSHYRSKRKDELEARFGVVAVMK